MSKLLLNTPEPLGKTKSQGPDKPATLESKPDWRVIQRGRWLGFLFAGVGGDLVGRVLAEWPEMLHIRSDKLYLAVMLPLIVMLFSFMHEITRESVFVPRNFAPNVLSIGSLFVLCSALGLTLSLRSSGFAVPLGPIFVVGFLWVVARSRR